MPACERQLVGLDQLRERSYHRVHRLRERLQPAQIEVDRRERRVGVLFVQLDAEGAELDGAVCQQRIRELLLPAGQRRHG